LARLRVLPPRPAWLKIHSVGVPSPHDRAAHAAWPSGRSNGNAGTAIQRHFGHTSSDDGTARSGARVLLRSEAGSGDGSRAVETIRNRRYVGDLANLLSREAEAQLLGAADPTDHPDRFEFEVSGVE
jgi:hypothetical protein